MLAPRLLYFWQQYKDWLPGVAETQPRLGFRFRGSVQKKGACTSPLFHFQVVSRRVSRGWVLKQITYFDRRAARCCACLFRSPQAWTWLFWERLLELSLQIPKG
jgi:hypothetical protein